MPSGAPCWGLKLKPSSCEYLNTDCHRQSRKCGSKQNTVWCKIIYFITGNGYDYRNNREHFKRKFWSKSCFDYGQSLTSYQNIIVAKNIYLIMWCWEKFCLSHPYSIAIPLYSCGTNVIFISASWSYSPSAFTYWNAMPHPYDRVMLGR